MKILCQLNTIRFVIQCLFIYFEGEGQYKVSFVPVGPGTHLIRPIYGGMDVRGELSLLINQLIIMYVALLSIDTEIFG